MTITFPQIFRDDSKIRLYRKKEHEILSLIQTTFKDYKIPPLNRICECGLKPARLWHSVAIIKKPGKPARIICQRCESTRGCPICRSIALSKKQRASEIIFKNAIANGYHLVMVTFTQPYEKGKPLSEIKNNHSQAKRAFKRGGSFQRIKKEIGLLGTVGAYHIKVNDYGDWNCHSHEIWILKSVDNLKKLQEDLREMWLMQCKKLITIKNPCFFLEFGLHFKFNIREIIVKYLYKIFDGMETGKEEASGYDVFSLLNSEIPNRTALFLEYLTSNIGNMYSTTNHLDMKVLKNCSSVEGGENADPNRKRTHQNDGSLSNKGDGCIDSYNKDLKHTDEKRLKTENRKQGKTVAEEDTCLSDDILEEDSNPKEDANLKEDSSLEENFNPKEDTDSKEDADYLDKGREEEQKIFYISELYWDYICRNGTIIADILDYVDDHEEELSEEEFKKYIQVLMEKMEKKAQMSISSAMKKDGGEMMSFV